MIKTLSPYYLTVPFTNPSTSVVCNSFTMKLFIWNGNKTAVPSTPEYEKTIINASVSNGDHKLDISKLVNDFIDFSCTQSLVTSLENGNNQVWVKTEVYYDDQPTLSQFQTISLATKGYGYFLEGQNPQLPINKILLQGNEFKVNRNGFFVLPVLMDEPEAPVVEFIITGVSGDEISFTIDSEPDSISLRYRRNGDVDWIYELTLFDTISPIEYLVPLTGLIDLQLYYFDSLTSAYIYSNIFTYTQ